MKIDSKKMEKALNYLNKVNPAGYAQLLLLPFGPVPGYAWEDPNNEWWSSEQANSMYQSIKDAFKDGPKPGGPTKVLPGAKYSYQTHNEGKMNKSKLKTMVKEILSAMEEVKKTGVSPDKLKHTECPKCKNKVTTLKSTNPVKWGCDKCKHTWNENTDNQVNEEHGDVHYWGAQPKGPGYKISTGYTETPSLKETKTSRKQSMPRKKQELRQLVIEAAKEVIAEYQHEKQHEQEEISLFGTIKATAEQLIAMHQKGDYNESKELALIRQIKDTALKIESMHTGTKITTNEKAIQ